jgi:NADH-quinone oxidoreductase subunit A
MNTDTLNTASTLLNFDLMSYLPVFIFMIMGVIIGVAPMAIGRLLSRKMPSEAKNAPYECGFSEFEDARIQFDIRYYLLAILFIIFDLEAAFLFPWGASLDQIGWFGYFAMIIFLLEFFLGFFYAWRKGAFDWE